MRILIVGGTGLLGYHAALELLRRGHQVATVAVPDAPLGDWFPRQVRVHEADVFKLDARRCRRLFEGCDAMVYAVGPDDRYTPSAPAYDFFRERLVDACGRVVLAAREAGVGRCVVLGSYFTHFDREWPQKRLALRHPYVRCRVEQAARVFEEGGDTMRVSVLELPYIFGVIPGREPLWKGVLLDRLRRMPVILYPRGGSAMISAAHVGEAVAGAVERGRHGESYPIGDENLTWDEMLEVMLRTLAIDKPVHHIPRFLGTLFGRSQRKADARRGREAGLDYEWLFRDVMTDYLYIDAAPSVKALRYGRGGVREAIEETVRASYPERFRANAAR
jgi:nucleoside-diphosphate-sugar epimerase